MTWDTTVNQRLVYHKIKFRPQPFIWPSAVQWVSILEQQPLLSSFFCLMYILHESCLYTCMLCISFTKVIYMHICCVYPSRKLFIYMYVVYILHESHLYAYMLCISFTKVVYIYVCYGIIALFCNVQFGSICCNGYYLLWQPNFHISNCS